MRASGLGNAVLHSGRGGMKPGDCHVKGWGALNSFLSGPKSRINTQQPTAGLRGGVLSGLLLPRGDSVDHVGRG